MESKYIYSNTAFKYNFMILFLIISICFFYFQTEILYFLLDLCH